VFRFRMSSPSPHLRRHPTCSRWPLVALSNL